ncbi:MAG: hypothetical protein AB7E04_08530 [Desulfobacteraceae bacterium]
MINICNSSLDSQAHDIFNQLIKTPDYFDCSNVKKEHVKKSTKFMLNAYSDGLISEEQLNSYITLFLQCLLEAKLEKKLSEHIDKLEYKIFRKIYERE